MNVFEKQLAQVERLASRKASEIERQVYEKYHPIAEQVIAFIRKKKVLMYGGSAINLLLPDRLRFYKGFAFPDVDVMSVRAKELADEVVRHFARKGYTFSTATEALHPGTWRLFMEGMPVLDITQVSQAIYDRLAKGGVMTDVGIRTVHPHYLRLSMHILLSQPRDSRRWSKTLERVFAFYKKYPTRVAGCTARLEAASVALTADEAALVEAAEAWVRDKTTGVLCGVPVFRRMLGKGAGGPKPWRIKGHAAVDVLVDEAPRPFANNLMKYLKGARVPGMRVEEAGDGGEAGITDEFMPKRAVLWVGETLLVCFIQTTACVSYVDVGGHRLASLQTVTRMAMAHQFSELLTAEQEAAYECMSNMLVELSMKDVTGKNKALLQAFVIQCYGHQPGMATLQRARLARRKGV